jgi:hypothetical protein
VSEVFERIKDLVKRGSVRISDHGYDELADDNLSVAEVFAGVVDALVIEDYPAFPKGSCALVLQKDSHNNPVHVVWGIPKGCATAAVLVTAYRPDPARWADGYTRRR